jgi:multimeric flavodoxin WrbA
MRKQVRIEKEETKMKILAVQGSPRSPKVSNTEILLQQFLRGAESEGAETETIYLREKKITHCIGCFSCWFKHPGICAFKDDMPALLEQAKECDILVYATPLYSYNMTGLLKIFIDRLLPADDPHFIKDEGIYRHPARYGKERKIVLISNCGLPEASHFDGLRRVFRQIEHASKNPLVGEILMPAGPLLTNEFFKSKIKIILDAVYKAGGELVCEGKVSKETELLIQKPLVPEDEYATMVNAIFDGELKTG